MPLPQKSLAAIKWLEIKKNKIKKKKVHYLHFEKQILLQDVYKKQLQSHCGTSEP